MENADSIWPFALTSGTSKHPKDGASLLSAVSWLVYGDLSNRPACVSGVVAEIARNVNDLLPNYRRQALKSYIPRLIDTNDGDSTARAAPLRASVHHWGVVSPWSGGCRARLLDPRSA